jgi:hypothetical protein
LKPATQILVWCLLAVAAWAVGVYVGRMFPTAPPRPPTAEMTGMCVVRYPCAIFEDRFMHPNNPKIQRAKK